MVTSKNRIGRGRGVALALALILASLGTLIRAEPAQAMQAWIADVRSDCASVEAGITLIYTHDDGFSHDRFRLEIYEGTSTRRLARIDESLGRDQSPFYWQTGRIGASSSDGLYRLEMWDMDEEGKRVRRIDMVYHQCYTGASWRGDEPFEEDPDIPETTCWVWVPVYSRNTAPEPGAVLAVWTYGHAATDPHYYLTTLRVWTGQRLDTQVRAPCGVYLKLYFQPDSTKLLYFMRSQYHPNDFYGTPVSEGPGTPVYTTLFPGSPPTLEGLGGEAEEADAAEPSQGSGASGFWQFVPLPDPWR